ncbi:MAG: DNA-directed RNA polymerase subunit beta' [Planctomycetota bacterium]|nr:MAG: DNA-directed RNA polymerase subunit beta' [Planctomycetota bacterium]
MDTEVSSRQNNNSSSGGANPLRMNPTDNPYVTIRLASHEDIRSWSFGEVRKPETINYRTYRPEKDGLFCEKIFGPTKDWECFCGKYKGIKHKNIICDRCGVQVTHSKVRRTRMGHINLAAPVGHIWFFKATPSRIGNLLGVKLSHLDKVIYFQEYIVTEPGDSGLELGQLLSEDAYRESRTKFGADFEADMGAEAVKKLLLALDLPVVSEELREELKTTRSKQRKAEIVKRLRTVEMLRDSPNKPSWMVLDVVPVIPPDLRPLVLLDSGNFATSDLNDLYRRLINRNNRLKKLLDLNAPEVIIRNEKRMLQQSVDALFDNSRCRRPVLGTSNRPLKSLTDMIKGKQGRFRENLLGKRVDYSARSVIVVGPELKLHQCGLPKVIALELYQPFIIRRLKELGFADTIKSAKKMLERKDEEVWDILEEVIHEHPVLLNRAPTLHRMGIQAFQPVLVEGNAIRLHPLVCAGFNADFDGDQMAVHLPLSYEAQIEATALMISTNNIFTPANGSPIISPSQDIVLGCFYLTTHREGEFGEGMTFTDEQEVFRAYGDGKAGVHAQVRVRLPKGKAIINKDDRAVADGGLIETTVGRVLFNDILPDACPYWNVELDKGTIKRVISEAYELIGKERTVELLDSLKSIGFKSATRAGLSFATVNLITPGGKEGILTETDKEVLAVNKQYRQGVITEGERYNQVIDLWTHARERVGEEMMREWQGVIRDGKKTINPVFIMERSGARGTIEQIRQLAGMRGLMAKPSGKIIETPIKSNFREGLRVLEYFSSTHGARKGLADTALKTADSGYLTRKLADVAQNIVVSTLACETINGISKSAVMKGDKVDVPLHTQIRGRVARDTITDIVTDEVIVEENQLITLDIARRIEALGYEKVRVRSPLTCEADQGICAMCYGMDLSRGKMAEMGLAIGIIAAQSIGEPGTQLTMRTFHIGGTASRALADSKIKAGRKGVLKYLGVKFGENLEGERVSLDRNGILVIVDDKDRELDRYAVPLGALLPVADGASVKTNEILATWDPHSIPIFADRAGKVRYIEIIEGKTLKRETDAGGVERMTIMDHKGDLHPQISLEDADGTPLTFYPIPERAFVEVKDGVTVKAGTLIAKTPRESIGTQDITGGLPRVTEIFEARRPKEPAIMAEIDGTVELVREMKRGKRTINVINDESGVTQEHLVPHGKHLKVQSGDRIEAGSPLIEGPLIPQDILRINGEDALQQYLLREVQGVYRSQNVAIDEKHIEVIVSQMLRRVQVNDPGDTDFLPDAVVDKFRFRSANTDMVKTKKRPASAEPVLLGITKAALQSDSMISAASFQETTKVLTEAAIGGRRDNLVGLKENVILGNMVPTGTGFRPLQRTRVKHNVELPPLEQDVPTDFPPLTAEGAV